MIDLVFDEVLDSRFADLYDAILLLDVELTVDWGNVLIDFFMEDLWIEYLEQKMVSFHLVSGLF